MGLADGAASGSATLAALVDLAPSRTWVLLTPTYDSRAETLDPNAP